MLNAEEQRSEIAHLLANIRQEHENIKQIFIFLEEDTSKYLFIAEKREHMYKLRGRLQELVGDAASAMIAKELEACPECKKEIKENDADISDDLSRGDI